MPATLHVHGLTHRFGERTALDDVTFDVRPGRVTGFVGANGAGKTPTARHRGGPYSRRGHGHLG